LPTRRYVLMRNAAAPFWMDQMVSDTDVGRAKYSYVFPTVDDQGVDHPMPEYAGELAPIGRQGGDYWLYFPAVFDGTGLTTTAMLVKSANRSSKISYTLMFQDGSQESYTQTVGTPVQVLNGTTVRPCWVRIDTYVCAEAGQTSSLVVFPSAGARALWPAYPPPQVTVSTAPYTSSRVTALTMLATNVSRVQIKQGTIMGARFSSLTPAFYSAVPSDVNGVHPAARYYGACENGLYLVAPPTQDSEQFVDAVMKLGQVTAVTSAGIASVSTNNVYYVPIVDFDTDDPFLAAFISEEVSVDETIMAITVDIHLEFRSSSPLFQVGISAVPLETYHAAQLVVAQAGYFYENPTHWRELASRIARLAGQVLPMLFPSSRVARAAGTAALILGRGARTDMTQRQMVKPRQRVRRVQRRKVRSQTEGRANARVKRN